jgi:hypothetical protein
MSADGNDRIQLRILVKSWEQDGAVRDNAPDLNWLTQQGWKVDCTEPLGEDAGGAGLAVLYVLGWERTGAPPLQGGTAPAPAQIQDIKCKTATPQVILACHATRGRILISDPDNPAGTVSVPPVPAPACPGPVSALVGLKLPGLNRVVAVMCCHDAAPGAAPGVYLEAAPATATVDVLVNPGEGNRPTVTRVFGGEIAAGQAVTSYVQFVPS